MHEPSPAPPFLASGQVVSSQASVSSSENGKDAAEPKLSQGCNKVLCAVTPPGAWHGEETPS